MKSSDLTATDSWSKTSLIPTLGSSSIGTNYPSSASKNSTWILSDKIYRVQTTSGMGTIYQYWDTESVRDMLSAAHESLHRDVQALKIVVNWQRKSLCYQSVYNAYLLGAINEGEFEEESDAYISETKTLPIQDVADVIVRLDRLLDFELGNAELAEHLEVPIQSVEQAVQLLGDSRLVKDIASIENSAGNIISS